MAPPERTHPLLTRRQVLAGGAGALLLAACGGSGEGGTAATTSSTAGQTLIRFFPDGQPIGVPVRLPFGLGDPDGVPLTSGPAEIRISVAPQDGDPSPVEVVVRHDKGIPRPYYPVNVTFEREGPHVVVAELPDGTARSAVTAVPASQAPPVPGPGDEMVSVATPTVEEPLGVDPVCTREPPCPLHGVSLDRALEGGKPIAFLIGTPAFCQTRICGPVLDVMLATQDEFGGRVTMIHNEVFTSTKLDRTTDAVRAFRLTSEPVLFLAGADGVVRERLDTIYDEVELRAALGRLVGGA